MHKKLLLAAAKFSVTNVHAKMRGGTNKQTDFVELFKNPLIISLASTFLREDVKLEQQNSWATKSVEQAGEI